MNSIDQLREDLQHPAGGTDFGRPDLEGIHRLGRRHRTRRRLVAAGGSLAVVAVLGGVWVGGQSLAPEAGSGAPVASQGTDEPTELSPLAKRTLQEIAGAEQVSAWQVVVPHEGAPRWDQRVDGRIVGEVVPLGGAYTGVTALPRRAFPDWLHDGTRDYEQTELADGDGGYPVGSTATGVLVQYGTSELACLSPESSSNEDQPGDGCYPAVVARSGDSAYLQWSMGTERFLDEGAPMELFTLEDYSAGRPQTVWIGGLDGTDVRRVDYVLTDGTVVEGRVSPGTLVPGESMFWAAVDGDVARVRAYDERGDLVEDHEVQPCDSPEDCEVR